MVTRKECIDPFQTDSVLLDQMLDWSRQHIRNGPDPRSGAKSFASLQRLLGDSITEDGMKGDAAFALFTDVIVPSTRPLNHPSSLSFVPAAPTPAALAFDAALSSAEIFAGNWDGASGAIHAENQALSWLADLAGWPATAGGVFVAGGTNGNLSALHAARVAWLKHHKNRPPLWQILCSAEAHSSIDAVARVMDAELLVIPADDTGCMDIDKARDALAAATGVFAIVANAGATNCGAIDDIAALADMAAHFDIWLHVDGAYGLAALADPRTRPQFSGIERADSFIVDPHKWLFSPFDSCALVYRNHLLGAQAHGQQGVYLDTLDQQAWNPSDYALHLTRRARGLPLWFSLVLYGTRAFASAIAQTINIAEQIAEGIKRQDNLQLILGPQLTVILFRANAIADEALDSWAEQQRRSGAMLCLPTSWRGEKVLRLCIVNPKTDPEYVLNVLKTLG